MKERNLTVKQLDTMSLSSFKGHPLYPRKKRPTRNSDKEIVPIEVDIMRLCARGHTTLEIAELLKMPEPTVETYRYRLMKRFKARNTPNLIAIAISSGILEPIHHEFGN